MFDEWFYWAAGNGSGVEVDFLLRRGRSITAIEVKASSIFGKDDLRGLSAIAQVRGTARRLLVYLGPRRLRTADGVEALPLEEFLADLAADRLIA